MQQQQLSIEPGGALSGTIKVPGDKSISHRSVILGSIANGVTQVDGFLQGEDCLATIRAFRQMGVVIEGPDQGQLRIHGVGKHGLSKPQSTLDVGNSGTSIRLLSGLLAGQPFDSVLTGDESLQRRPMERVRQPLNLMGAKVETTEGCPPVLVYGGHPLHGIDYEMPIASAQVKSSILLAGIFASGQTQIIEPGVSRDHTERMLTAFGYPIQKAQNRISIQGGGSLQATQLLIPGDISSAAFFIVGALISKQSDLTICNVGINPTRTGVLNILTAMGANIHLFNKRLCGDEPVADIQIKASNLEGIEIPQEWVPLAIDEFPAIFVAAACAKGRTVIRGAKELRLKESDRIQAMVDGLNKMNVDARGLEDGAIINGSSLHGNVSINSYGDHRIAMAFSMAGLVASGPLQILDCYNVSTSFPNFVDLAAKAGLGIFKESK